MKKLYFVTSNNGKITMFNQFVKDISLDYTFEMLNVEFLELHDSTLEKTALNKAKEALKTTDKDNVIISDIGIFIQELNGFPGVNTAFAVKTIGNAGIIKLMEGKNNRTAEFCVSIAYADKKGNIFAVSDKSDIEIDKVINSGGFGWDPIAIADGVTFSENLNHQKRIGPFKRAIEKIIKKIDKL